MSQYGPQYVTPRRGTPAWVVALLVIGGCGALGIAVIAILAAILFPVFARARESARRASCLSNQKQLATAALMYAQDWGGFPPRQSWQPGLTAYTRSVTLYVCPSRPLVPNGYAFNAYMSGRPTASLAAPAQAPLLFESSLGVPNASDALQSFATPHVGMGGIAYGDGHVKLASKAPPATAGLSAKPPRARTRRH